MTPPRFEHLNLHDSKDMLTSLHSSPIWMMPKVLLDQTPRQPRFELPAFDDDLTPHQTANAGPHWSEVKPAVPETWGRFLWRKTVFCGVKTLAGC